jgi:hypothetical protein
MTRLGWVLRTRTTITTRDHSQLQPCKEDVGISLP